MLDRFFRWVWVAIALILTSGLWIFFVPLRGEGGWYLYLMLILGLVMMGIFTYIYTQPYQRMGEALAAGNLSAAGEQMNLIRRAIGINLLLGLLVSVIATLKPF